jgi:bifunctional DNA-binding transcriptional regulator/antitoxin component of YhaV-PrlF toxin-antitoxin module
MAVKIKTYRVSRSGSRGKHLALPKVWLDDLKLQIGDHLDMYRDEADRLIICPPGVSPTGQETAEAAR